MPALRLPRLSSLRAFEHPGYLTVWLGSLVSTIGSWMETVALGVYVTEVTGQAEWTGGIAALAFLPGLFLSPLGGALADRFERRAYLVVGITGQMLLAGILTALAFTHQLSVPVVAVCAFFNGSLALLMGPGFMALLSELVPPEQVHSAMSLNSALINLGRIIGPLLTTLVLAASGIEWALLINTLSFLAPSLALAAGGIFLLGASYMICMTGINTVCQLRAPPELRARIGSLFGMVFTGGYAVGVWMQGALADRLGVRFITVLASLLFLTLSLGLHLLRPRSFDATESTHEALP